MSEHKARERREARMAEERKEENNAVAFMACILASGDVASHVETNVEFHVLRARAFLAEAHKESTPAGHRDTNQETE